MIFSSHSISSQMSGVHLPNKPFGERIGPLIAAVFALYLLISSNFLGDLFQCNLRKVLTRSYTAKHTLAFLTMFLSVNLVSRATINWNIGIVLCATAVLYIIFMISSTLSIQFFIPFILLISAIYFLNLWYEDLNTMTVQGEGSVADKELWRDQAESITVAQYTLASMVAVCLLVGVTTSFVHRRTGDSPLSHLISNQCRPLGAR